MSKKISISIILNLILSTSCERWPNGYLITRYSLEKCIKAEQLLIDEADDGSLSISRDCANSPDKCFIRYNLSRGITNKDYAAIYLSKSGCQLNMVNFVSRNGCDSKSETYDQKLCAEYMNKAKKNRDDFMAILVKKLNLNIESAKNEEEFHEDAKNYKSACDD